MADLVDSHFQSHQNTYRADRPYLMEKEEFLHYLDYTTPDSLSRESLHTMLRKGIDRGLPYRRQGQSLFFDFLDSWNWLYDHDPLFFAADYWALEEKRQRFFVQEGRRMRSRVAWQHYQVTYCYRIFPERLQSGQRVKVFLPYPIPAENQRDICLLSCTPAEMEASFAPSMGFFYGCVLDMDPVDRPWDCTYTCKLRVGEQPTDNGHERIELSARERQRCLKLEPGFLELPEVMQFRRQLDRHGGGIEARARMIYNALVKTKRFKKTKDWTQSLTYSTASVLNGAGGHCITLARAFVALCRAEGIPAREKTGALIGYPVGKGQYAMKTYREPVFGHTWVEIFLEGKGWVPVEFHGIVIGKEAMTDNNVTEPELRIRILENSARYLDYYFGRLDNQRLVCSDSVKRIPQCLVEQPEYPAWDERRWQAPANLRFECQLQVECI